MSYRDQLEAALQRVAQLERDLARAETGQGDELAPLRRRVAALEGELRAAQAAMVERAVAFEQQLREALKQASSELPTLTEHNRSFPPAVGGSPAGVLCPRCQALGDAVEMVVDAPVSMARGVKDGCTFDSKSTLCPRCLHLQVIRTS